MAEITESKNFIHAFIEEDIAEGGRYAGQTVHTRFPPEPNGYLHIGHCKALIIDFGTAEKFNGLCNLRMDDTNPTKEDVEFVEAIKEDIHWLGFDWGDRFYYGSDYFEKDYEYAVELIKKGLAYVCELTPEQFDFVTKVNYNAYFICCTSASSNKYLFLPFIPISAYLIKKAVNILFPPRIFSQHGYHFIQYLQCIIYLFLCGKNRKTETYGRVPVFSL